MQYDDFHIRERAEIIRIVDQFACLGIILSHSIKFARAEKQPSKIERNICILKRNIRNFKS